MSCPDDTTLRRLMEGRLPPDEAAAVERHVADCSSCRPRRASLSSPNTSSITEPDQLPAPRRAVAHATQSLTDSPPAAGTFTSPGSPLERGGTLGRYLILDMVGAGGMGVVYAAYDPDLDRKVALKLLNPAAPSEAKMLEFRTRLLREAQALARLSHPNVITVYDVGILNGQIFVAMEFVDGGTLSHWLAEKPRTYPEIVTVFLRAGEGLAAAHDAGLIHRDFKPANVLVGKDGRVRVTDFGLVRPAAHSELESSQHRSGPDGESEDPLLQEVTRAGGLVGTPAYMAPEQIRRAATDARSDQFSFCVALYQSLFGLRPFSGATTEQLLMEIVAGRVRPAPPDARVPGWLRRVVMRGLSVSPSDRFPSMHALLAALSHDRTARLWRSAAAVAAVAGLTLIAGAAGLLHERRSRVCTGAEAKLTGVWDAQKKGTVQAAFDATHVPFAHDALASVYRLLDQYAATWVAAHTDACEATRVRGEQSEQMMEARMLCLERRRVELGKLTELLDHADADVVERSMSAAQALSPVHGCDALELASGSARKVPDTPDARAKVEAQRAVLSEAKALTSAGKYARAVELNRAVVEAARALKFRPLEAEALLSEGLNLDKLGQPKVAEQRFTEAILAAEAGSDVETEARADMALAQLVGQQQSHHEQGRQLLQHAAALLEALGKRDELEAWLHSTRGAILWDEGKYEDALSQYQRAVALHERANGPDSLSTADTLTNLGAVLNKLDRFDEARRAYERSLAIREKVFGPTHPSVASTLNNLAVFLHGQAQYAEALALIQRAVAIRMSALGPENPKVAINLSSLGNVHFGLGHYAEAKDAYRKALAIWEKGMGANNSMAATLLANLANVLEQEGEYDEATRLAERSIAITQKVSGPEHADMADRVMLLSSLELDQRRPARALALANRAMGICQKALGPHSGCAAEAHAMLAQVLIKQGKASAALAHYRETLSVYQALYGGDHPDVAKALAGVGSSYLALRKPVAALEPLERVVKMYEGKPGNRLDLADARLDLARALWDAGKDRERAKKLAAQARDTFAADPAAQRQLANAKAWISHHR